MRKIKIYNLIVYTLYLLLFLPQKSISQTVLNNLPIKNLVVSETENTVTCLDANKSKITIKKNPQRVVSCYTSFASLWYLSGGKLIAIPNTDHKELKSEPYAKLELIGSVVAPNAEKILSLKPDLVLLCSQMEKHRALNQILQTSNIDSILLEYQNFYDFVALLKLFTKINNKELEDIPLAKKTINNIEEIINKSPKNKNIRFLSIFASANKNPAAETSNANTALIVKLLGGNNIMDDIKTNKKSLTVDISMEKIIEADPDIIFITTMGGQTEIAKKMEKDFQTNPLWSSLSAVKNKKFYFLPNELFLYKANENYPSAFNHVYKILYGDSD